MRVRYLSKIIPLSISFLGHSPLWCIPPVPGDFYTDGPSEIRAVALTFDDGPGPQTEDILSILKENELHATFFMNGKNVEKNPDIAKRVSQEGHEVADHTYQHTNFYKLKQGEETVKRLREEIQTSRSAILEATGQEPRFLRMPHGYVRSWVKDIAREEGYVLVNWTAGYDWHKMNVDEMLKSYLKMVKPGAIFLFHDGGSKRDKTIAVLKRLIPEIRQEGLDIITVSELLGVSKQTSLK